MITAQHYNPEGDIGQLGLSNINKDLANLDMRDPRVARLINLSEMHQVDESQKQAFVDAMGIKEMMQARRTAYAHRVFNVVDAGCGLGGAGYLFAEEFYNIAEAEFETVKKTNPSAKFKSEFTSNIYLVDQIEQATVGAFQNLRRYAKSNGMPSPTKLFPTPMDLVEEELPTPTGIPVDLILAKMVLHEIPQVQQQSLIQKFYDALSPVEGRLVLWTNAPTANSPAEGAFCEAFRTIIQYKDQIAGLEEMAAKRYFPSQNEINNYLSNAGFKVFGEKYSWEREWSATQRIAELGGDMKKVEALNTHIAETFEGLQAQFPDTDIREQFGFFVDPHGYAHFNIKSSILLATK